MADPPFDLSKFDPSSLDLSHLHPAEQNRIRNRQFTSQELSLLLSGQNPWTESGKPNPFPSPALQSKEPTLDDLRRICHADTLPLFERGDPVVRAALEAQWRAANAPPPETPEKPDPKIDDETREMLGLMSNQEEQEYDEKTKRSQHRIPFANPPEWWNRQDRINRAIQSGERPDPEDLAEEAAEKVRYERKLAEAFRKKELELHGWNAFPSPNEDVSFITGKPRTVGALTMPPADKPKPPSEPKPENLADELLSPPLDAASADKPSNRKINIKVWAEIKKHPGWYFLAFLVGGLPVGIGTIWPTLTHETVPEWLAEHGWPRLIVLAAAWVAVAVIIALVIIVRSYQAAAYQPRKVNDAATSKTKPQPNIILLGEPRVAFVTCDEKFVFREDLNANSKRAIVVDFQNQLEVGLEIKGLAGVLSQLTFSNATGQVSRPVIRGFWLQQESPEATFERGDPRTLFIGYVTHLRWDNQPKCYDL
ncbi:MAG TPA: hypothetical protein VEM96_09090 [Pyrinomonadaceae bacterium]|nr:hypothetical protein [Pyrinomonadaceae bacterium]